MRLFLPEIFATRMTVLLLTALFAFPGCRCDKPKQGLGIEWVLVEGGPRGDFFISKTEVTFAQFDSFCVATGYAKPNDEHWGRGNRPVINVNFTDAQNFCTWLSKAIDATIRLPDDSEYTFAAMGGKLSRGYKYSGSDVIDSVAWYSGNSGDSTHIVATLQPNELGIFDMSGNVWEWTRTPGSSQPPDTQHFIRCGAYDKEAFYCGVGVRLVDSDSHRQNNHGFRVIQEY